MTAIYNRLNAKGYEFINTVRGYDDDDVLRKLWGPSRKHDWKPILVQSDLPGLRYKKAKVADIPYAHDVLILRPSAISALQDILDAHGELLPLASHDGTELFAFNPRFVIDAIDKERSIYEQIPGTSIIAMRKYVFVESMIRDIDIFYVEFGPGQCVFSDRFVDRVKKAKLKGTEFIKLWSSHETP